MARAFIFPDGLLFFDHTCHITQLTGDFYLGLIVWGGLDRGAELGTLCWMVLNAHLTPLWLRLWRLQRWLFQVFFGLHDIGKFTSSLETGLGCRCLFLLRQYWGSECLCRSISNPWYGPFDGNSVFILVTSLRWLEMADQYFTLWFVLLLVCYLLVLSVKGRGVLPLRARPVRSPLKPLAVVKQVLVHAELHFVATLHLLWQLGGPIDRNVEGECWLYHS